LFRQFGRLPFERVWHQSGMTRSSQWQPPAPVSLRLRKPPEPSPAPIKEPPDPLENPDAPLREPDPDEPAQM